MKKFAVILSGCGVFDGAEIHESVLALLAIDEAGIAYDCAAPDIDQTHVINHLDGSVSESETRNVLRESARIARGEIKTISALDPSSYDAVILPGGFGAAKNLSNFAFDSSHLTVDTDLVRFLLKSHELGKPIGFACIAPAIAAKLFGPAGLEFTIGNDTETATALEQWGGRHINCPVNQIVIDNSLNIVTTPAYMLAQRISEAHSGISKMVAAVLERT